MIAHLRGKLADKQPNFVIIEVGGDAGGVGYAVTIPVSTYSQLGQTGSEAALHIYTHVREDALALFGFATRGEKAIFEQLITVSGIGARLAVTILSGLPVDDLSTAIRSGDVPRLTKIPGVGKKTGERMILELREKLGPAIASSEATAQPNADDATQEEVISALLNLGCTRDAARKAVGKALKEKSAEDILEFESLFRRSLDLMSR
jgi:Holliday junction DNA helicase RuvA